MDFRNIVIVGLLACLVWFGSAIIRLEQFHYAAMLEACPLMQNELDRVKWITCLERKKDLRASPLYDLAYGLDIL
ncbi:hypothetical protein [Rhizorhapis sp.]|uniref:hypothetical protein n=1 Tax=Rhizorhapis sp. TaxID=1968842 RepID=UPI002B467AA8|nr:hypothetical protein [Rhizorhapis sp.]HKR16061.1 hypothetical protein [Rhizorhapis sp.]